MHSWRIAQLEQRAALRVPVRPAARGVARRLRCDGGELTAGPGEAAESAARADCAAVEVSMSEPMSGVMHQLSHRLCPLFRGKMTRVPAYAV